MGLHQNKPKATEAIKEAKAHCGYAIREAEACHTTLGREVEAHHATAEVGAHYNTDIRKAESHCMEKAHSIQQLHADNMQYLEMDALEEEGRDCLSFLVACGTALQACPPRGPWSPNGPPSTAHGEHTTGHSSKHSPHMLH